MANTRGKTHVHGPAATGTIKAGSVTPSSAAPSVGPGSGANSGNLTTISPGKVSPGFGSPISGGAKGVNAGNKTTINTPGKKASYGSGAGVGANTSYKRKKQRRLGTNNGQTPA